jgi:predicted GH43/DUF377 family glycosyl hydrolase
VLWRKQGLVYVADGSTPWAKSHAMLPTPWFRKNGTLRVFIGCCDSDMVSRVGFVDLDPNDPMKILRVADIPVLDIGVPGAFDDSGVIPSCVVTHDRELWMYYVGFQRGQRVRYFMFSGLAVSHDDGESFQRVSAAPILERIDGELLVRTAPYVRKVGDHWHCWYVGGNRFIAVGAKEVPTYTLRHLQSSDGIDWPHSGMPLFEPNGPDEYGFGRPWLERDASGYRMWYSIRSRRKGYRLGFAISEDGVAWTRLDRDLGLDVSPSGWDSEMIAYASVLSTLRRKLLFYNGNDFGRTGFGLAIEAG